MNFSSGEIELTNEFERQLKKLMLDSKTEGKINEIIDVAGREFPCLSCPSKNECENFKWYTKWFGK